MISLKYWYIANSWCQNKIYKNKKANKQTRKETNQPMDQTGVTVIQCPNLPMIISIRTFDIIMQIHNIKWTMKNSLM